jgi:hypothetical protein
MKLRTPLTALPLLLLALPACPKKDAVEPSPVPPEVSAPSPESGAEPPSELPPTPRRPEPTATGVERVVATRPPIPEHAPDAAPAPEAWEMVKPAPIPAPTKLTGTCVPLGADTVTFWEPEAAGGAAIDLCYVNDFEAGQAECWRVDVDAATVTAANPSPAFLARLKGNAPTLAPDLRVEDGGARVFAGKVELALGGEKAGQVGRVGPFVFMGPPFDSDFMALVEAETGPFIRIFDAASGRLVRTIDIAAFESPCPQVFAAGALIYVEASVCAGPGAMGYFIDPATGRTVGTLGATPQSAAAWNVSPVALQSGAIAFREQYGMGLFVHDPNDARLLSTLNLSGALRRVEDGEWWDNAPDEGGLARLSDGRLVSTFGGGSRDRLVVIDAAGRAVTRLLELPRCP